MLVATPPTECDTATILSFIELVRVGGEVGGAVLESNVRTAHCLLRLYRDGYLSGVAALKNPLASYRQRIEDKTGVPVLPSSFPFELGYVFVLPEAREQGIAGKLVHAACEVAGDKGLFATSRTNNQRMHATLERAGFRTFGRIYNSSDGERQLQLFLRVNAQPINPPDAAR